MLHDDGTWLINVDGATTMLTLDVAQNVLEGFGCLHTTAIDGVADTRRGNDALDGALAITLRAFLRGRIIAFSNRQLHVNHSEATRGTTVVVIRRKSPP